jgi:cytidylate kinase
MGLIAVSGQPGCRFAEVARICAQRLGFELVNASRIGGLIEEEFGPGTVVPDKAFVHVVASLVARVATSHHLVLAFNGAEQFSRQFPGMLRVSIVAPETVRAGNLMLERRLERPAAKELLWELEAQLAQERRKKFGRASVPPHMYDLVLNAETLDSEQMVQLIENVVRSQGLVERGFFSGAAEAQMQFQIRLRLARYGIQPPSKVGLQQKTFAHQSEQVFANLLDFYRIAWEYEPKSFPVQWDRDGRVIESFTPDFYLPEYDLYVELTTMKQSLVTRKNRKVRLLRELYPQLNIQVFYQKDFENLVFKYGLTERFVKA